MTLMPDARRRARGPRRTRRPRPLIVLLAAVLGLALGFTLPSASAHAGDPQAWVSIRIDSMTPAIPKPDDTITITGTVTNTSKVTLSKLQAVMWRNQAPIVDADQLTQALGSSADDPGGSRKGSYYQQVTRSNDPATINLPADFPPGASASFTVSGSLAGLEFPTTPGIYLIGVQMRGTLDGLAGQDITLGRARTFLPVGLSEMHATKNATLVSSLLVLTASPSFVRTGVLANLDLASRIAPDGDLTRLLALAQQPGYSVAIDPALVETVRTLAKPHQVLAANGTLGAMMPASADATTFLQTLDEVPADRLFQLPYGQPDLAALADSGHPDLYDPTTGADVLPGVPVLVIPTGGTADAATMNLATEGEPAAVLLAKATTGQAGSLLQGPWGMPVVAYDANVLAGGPGPDPSDTATQIRQRFLAETYLQSTRGGGAVVRLITDPDQASAAPAADAPWLESDGLQHVLAETPTAWTGTLPSSADKAALTDDQVRAAAAQTIASRLLAELAPSLATTASDLAKQTALATSAAWRGQAKAQRSYLAPLAAQTGEALDGQQVHFGSAGRVIVTNKDTEGSPLTVVNDLDVDIVVNVEFTSGNTDRLVVPELTAQKIPAHSRRTLLVHYQPKTNGDVTVTARLTTTSGHPIAKPVSYTVSSTNLGMIGWLIAVAAAIVLVVSTAWRIRQVHRSSRAETETAPSEPPGT